MFKYRCLCRSASLPIETCAPVSTTTTTARPLAVDNNYDLRWDSWLLPRVDGQFEGTTDEIFQWAACKWGLPDDLLRAFQASLQARRPSHLAEARDFEELVSALG